MARAVGFINPRVAATAAAAAVEAEIPTTIDQLTDVDTSTTPPTDGQVLAFDGTADEWKPADLPAPPPPGAPRELTVTADAGAAHTLAAADVWGHRRFTDGVPVTLTVDTTHGFAIGDRARFTQAGAGQVTMVAAVGVTLNSRSNALKSAGQFAVWELECVGADEFDVLGDLTT